MKKILLLLLSLNVLLSPAHAALTPLIMEEYQREKEYQQNLHNIHLSLNSPSPSEEDFLRSAATFLNEHRETFSVLGFTAGDINGHITETFSARLEAAPFEAGEKHRLGILFKHYTHILDFLESQKALTEARQATEAEIQRNQERFALKVEEETFELLSKKILKGLPTPGIPCRKLLIKATP